MQTRSAIKLSSALLISLYSLGCSDIRQNFTEEMTQGCLYTAQIPNARAVCECISSYVADKFSDEELEVIMSKSQSSMTLNLRNKVSKYTDWQSPSMSSQIQKCKELGK
ncbi:hypothetical protein [uncultured Campylobacter sp.]|uniref:hypothetical protein n=1 Tax=uncultured Campylobacter sp. TaxID=218934 RepID=UPI003211B04A